MMSQTVISIAVNEAAPPSEPVDEHSPRRTRIT